MDKDIEDLFRLDGKVIILTGASGLIGREYNDILTKAGAIVIPVDIKGNEHTVITDISSEESVQNMVDSVLDNYGKIDVLINNAKYTGPYKTTFEECTLDEWNDSVSVNLTGSFICCQKVGKPMIKQGYGNIINIASTYGIVGPDQRIYEDSGINSPIHYSAVKGGIINMTRWLASYYAGKNIRVNTLSPGGVFNDQDEGFVNNYSYKTMLGRMANKEDYRGTMLFLCSDASKYMTGANLIVDGGWTAW